MKKYFLRGHERAARNAAAVSRAVARTPNSCSHGSRSPDLPASLGRDEAAARVGRKGRLSAAVERIGPEPLRKLLRFGLQIGSPQAPYGVRTPTYGKLRYCSAWSKP